MKLAELVGLVVLLLLVFGVCFWFQQSNLMPPSDGGVLVKQAESFVFEGNFFVNGKPQTSDPIGYSVFLGFWCVVFGFGFFSVKLFSVFCALVAVVGLYFLARCFVRPVTAWFVCLAFCCNWLVLYYFVEAAPWALVLALFVWSMYFLRNKNFFVFSVLFGVLAFVRYEFIFVFLFYCFIWLVNKRLKWWNVLACCAIFFVCVSPWMAKNYYYSGNPFYISQFRYFGVDSDSVVGFTGGIAEEDHIGLWGVVKQGVKTAVLTFCWKLPQACNPFVLLFVVVGFVFFNLLRYVFDFTFFWPFFFAYLGMFFVIGFVEQQYLLPVVMLCYVWFGLVVEDVFKGVDGSAIRLLFFVGVVLILLMGCVGFVYRERPSYLEEPLEYKRAGEWLEGRDGRLLAVKPQFWYYSGLEWEWIPDSDLGSVVSFMRGEGFNYLVFDERLGVPRRPQLEVLLGDVVVDGLVKVYDDRVGDYAVVIYALE